MIFLYRFDILQLDGVISNTVRIDLVPEDVVARARTTYRMTNYGESVNSYDSGSSAFLPYPDGPDAPVAFLSEAIEHDQIRMDGERSAGQVSVSIPMEHPIGQLYAVDTPAVQTWLTLMQWDKVVPGSMPLVVWVGQVVNAEYDETRCRLTLDHLQKVLLRPGLTAKHPRSCGHLLYDAATCGVKADKLAADGYWKFREDGAVASVSEDGMVVTVPEAANKPDGWFAQGYLTAGGQYTEQSGQADHIPRSAVADRPIAPGMQVYAGYRRAIVSHQGSTLRLATPMPPGRYNLAELARVTLFAGCDGALATCKNKFSNVPRYGGYPYIPIKNPFEVGMKNASGN
jgi:hypothetical protein